MNLARIDSEVMDYLEDLLSGQADRREAEVIARRLTTYAALLSSRLADVKAADPLPFEIPTDLRYDPPHAATPPHFAPKEPHPLPKCDNKLRRRDARGRMVKVVLYLHKNGPSISKDIAKFVGFGEDRLRQGYLTQPGMFVYHRSGRGSGFWAVTPAAVAEYLTPEQVAPAETQPAL